ncbi:MAG TPA: GNAT family N-acetyltransferase [Actinomycetaceae bacterium]|nr:GNAT family N-acetyltransferase [Actinomycetaceae bacterium]
MSGALRRVTDEQYLRVAHGTALPIEQAPVWDAFDRLVAGREPWRRYVYLDGDTPQAVVSLTQIAGPGPLSFLWAKNGPVWFTPPTAAEEAQLRAHLGRAVRRHAPRAAFVRLHAFHEADDLEPVLQGITWDRTVIVDLSPGEEEVFAGMKQQGRRAIRKALRDESLTVTEETAQTEESFAELYAALQETGAREGFGPHPARHYLNMLHSLGPEHARMFVTRREGRALAWAIVTVNDGHALYSVGASNAEARGAYAADLLQWRIMQTLAGEGIDKYDLAGAGSDRFPGMHGLTQFKTKFERTITEIAPAWDFPVRPWVYRGIVAARNAKHYVRQARR